MRAILSQRGGLGKPPAREGAPAQCNTRDCCAEAAKPAI
jgi:hypothetical protein